MGHFRTQVKSCTSHKDAMEMLLLSRLTHMPSDLPISRRLFMRSMDYTYYTRWAPALSSWAFESRISQLEYVILLFFVLDGLE